jgi:NADPH-dependent ferric siderophore reductase
MRWLQDAKAGDPLYLAGPGGGYEIPSEAKKLVLVADDTAMPAAGTILEALTDGCEATVLCEVSDRAEERPLSDRVQADVRWAHLDGAQAGTALERAVRSVDAPAEAHWWVAGEAGAMRRIRTYLLKERGVDPARVHLRGYWRLGEVNHPDHDYGND